MRALLVHLRAELGRRWPAWVGAILLAGALGGIVIGTVAGARRTSTAFDRMTAPAEVWDVLVNPNEGVGSALDPAAVADLPSVEHAGMVEGVGAVLLDSDGVPIEEPLVLAASDESIFVDYARPHIRQGRPYDPSDPTSIMVSESVAERYGMEAGDEVRVGTISDEELAAWEEAGAVGVPPLTPRPARIDAVTVSHDEIVVDEAFDFGHVHLSPAFAEAYELEPFFYGIAVRLRNGQQDVDAFRAAVGDLAPGEAIEFKTAAAVEEIVARGTRPNVVALWVFAAVVGVAGIVVAVQGITRRLADLRGDASALGAIGLPQATIRSVALLRCALMAVGAAVVSVALAIAMSPVFPVGVAARAEVDPGVDVDVLVLGVGAATLIALLVVCSLPAVRRVTVTSREPSPSARAMTARIASAVPGPAASLGLRAALTGPKQRPASALGAAAGVGLAVAAVSTALTFGASLDHLVTTPTTFGWNWQALVDIDIDSDDAPRRFAERADDADELTGLARLTMDQVTANGVRIPAVGIEYRVGDVGPTVVDGKRPSAADEIALGGRTMRRLGVGIGDTVEVGAHGERERLRVVGQAVFAGLGTYPGADRTELGKGALLERDTLTRIGEGFGFESLAIEASDASTLERSVETILAAGTEGEAIVHDRPQRPADIQNLERLRNTPNVLAGVLAVLGGAALALVLVSGVRERRRELALLKTLGLRRRQVAATVAWQASATALVAAAIGVPLGIVVGRASWSVLATALGVADAPQIPLTVIGLVGGVVVLANLVALVPATLAARTRPAQILRAE